MLAIDVEKELPEWNFKQVSTRFYRYENERLFEHTVTVMLAT